MPSFVPRSLEPYQKRELLEKRISQLRSAIATGASQERLATAAEKVRSATMGVIKARRSLLAEHLVALTGGRTTYPDAEAISRQLTNLNDEEQQWRSLAPDAIVEQFSTEARSSSQHHLQQ